MAQPLISILMPVREFTPYTNQAIASVLAQSHDNLEVLVIANDNVDELQAQIPTDQRIRVINREFPGIIGALNTGLVSCAGEYIARMDSDDICHSERLERQLAFALQHQDIGLLATQVEIFSSEGAVESGNQRYQHWLNTHVTPQQISESCFVESPMPHPSLFAHRQYWSNLGGYRDMGWPEDYDLILRSWLVGIAMAKPSGVLLQWREHPNRLTRTDERYSRQAFIRAKAWALTQKGSTLELDNGRATWICGTGRNARYWHDALAENGVSVLGFVELDNARSRHQKRHLPVITYNELAANKGDALVISAISNTNARGALKTWFTEQKMRCNRDFVVGG